MNNKNVISSLKTALLGTAGVILGHLIAPHLNIQMTTAEAQNSKDNVISTKAFELVDQAGRRRILMAQSDGGSPGIWFFDKSGKARMNLGLYEDNNAFIVLNDENNQAVQIFRTVGNNNAPVLVMKSKGQDRIVLGLNFGDKPDPFFVFYDSNGTKNTVFGNY